MSSKILILPGVALRKESVDRNDTVQVIVVIMYASLSARRAWIEIHSGTYHPHFHVSLSARRAWIEIASRWRVSGRTLVALRKESVDRNAHAMPSQKVFRPSLSARRAWIEIVRGCLFCEKLQVALRKESVDRNLFRLSKKNRLSSLSARRAWIEMLYRLRYWLRY